MAQWQRICLPMQETQVGFLSREDPLEEEMATHCSIYLFFGCSGSSMLHELVSSCGERVLLCSCCALWLLIAVASLVAEHGLQGTQASAVAAPGL